MLNHRVVWVIFVSLILVLVGCEQADESEPTIDTTAMEINVEPESLMMGETTIALSFMADGEAVGVEQFMIEGDMNHAGMSPITQEVEGNDSGEFEVPFEWTMAGDWSLTVDGTLTSGEDFRRRYDFTITRDTMASGDNDMADMDMDPDSTEEPMNHSDMDMGGDSTQEAMDHADMDMGGGTVTASYMTITNTADADDRLVGAMTTVAEVVEIHETIMEDDVMRMMPVDDATIPTGDSLVMEPGGMHLMLIDLQEDLVDGDTITLTLMFESGAEVEIEAVVQDLPPEDTTLTVDDLTIENAWVRPMMR